MTFYNTKLFLFEHLKLLYLLTVCFLKFLLRDFSDFDVFRAFPKLFHFLGNKTDGNFSKYFAIGTSHLRFYDLVEFNCLKTLLKVKGSLFSINLLINS